MKPLLVATLFAGLGLGTLSLAAEQRPLRPGSEPDTARTIEVERLRPNLYLLKGGGGNSTVFVTSTGVVVVDAKNPGWGTALLEKIRTLTDKPVTMIINTHTHADHVGGNVEFPAVEVVAQENTRHYMEEMKPTVNDDERGTAPAQVFKLNSNRNLPTRAYKDRLTIGRGDDRIELFHFGPGHTGGDTFVVFPAVRAIATGDTFSNTNLPNVDTNNGGGAIGLTQSLGQASKLRGIDTVIPGHGDAALPFKDLQEYAQFNADFMNWARTEMKAGKTVDQAAAEYRRPDRYKSYVVPPPERIKRVLTQYYKEFANMAGGI